MNLEWSTIPFQIDSPYGTLTFNDDSNPVGLFLLDDKKCSVGAALRITKDDIPQASGAILHRPRLQAETLMSLGVEFWADRTNVACGSQLVDMSDLLLAHLNALLDADGGRAQWTPSGHPTRILDDVLWEAAAVPFIEGDATRGYTFALDSPFPYAIDLSQVTTVIAAGATATITNGGSAPFYPVVKVAPPGSAPLSSFSITNASVLDPDGNPFTLVYDASLPGGASIAAGHYVEFDFFRDTAYLDGSGANRKGGIDITVSDFFPLKPGANVITVIGGDATFLTNDAWAG